KLVNNRADLEFSGIANFDDLAAGKAVDTESQQQQEPKRSLMNRVAVVLFLILAMAAPLAAETPRGSLTIDRIAAIKTPSDAAWAPDGKTVAFLWDDAGVRNLFAVQPGQQPVALTNFPGSRD